LVRIFGPKREEDAGGWRRLHNEELHNLYTSPNFIRLIKSRRMRWVAYLARTREIRNAENILIGRPEGKTPLGKIRRRWEHNITMNLKEIVWEGVQWIHLAQ